jgi:hypothetical protein
MGDGCYRYHELKSSSKAAVRNQPNGKSERKRNKASTPKAARLSGVEGERMRDKKPANWTQAAKQRTISSPSCIMWQICNSGSSAK